MSREKKERKRQQLPRKAQKKKKKKKRKELDELPICTCTYVFLSIKHPPFLPSVFSPFWGGNFLVGLGRKHPGPTIYFPSSYPTKHTPKMFSFSFSLQNFLFTLFQLHTNTPLKELIVDNY